MLAPEGFSRFWQNIYAKDSFLRSGSINNMNEETLIEESQTEELEKVNGRGRKNTGEYESNALFVEPADNMLHYSLVSRTMLGIHILGSPSFDSNV